MHYTYDVFDRMIGKQLDTNGDGTYDSAQRFVYDGDNTVLVYDGSSSLTNRYLSGPDIDQVFADERASGALYWALADNQGTVRDLIQYNSGTNTTTVVNHIKYDSFGRITAQSDSTKTPLFAYTGRQWDADADLFYYRARWYDPKAGRFLSEDPLSFAAGDVNLSRYVGNAPTNYIDPSGLISILNPGGPMEPPHWDVIKPEIFVGVQFVPEQAKPPSPAPQQEVKQDLKRELKAEDPSEIFKPPQERQDDGYSNGFNRFIGENVIRLFVDEARLARPGNVADDLLVSTLVVTEMLGYVDPTPVSDVMNAIAVSLDGRLQEGLLIGALSFVPGPGVQLAKRLPFTNKILKSLDEIAGNTVELVNKLGRKTDDVADAGFGLNHLGRPACPDGLCFVAGTPVLVDDMNAEPILTEASDESVDRDTEHDVWLALAGLGVAGFVMIRKDGRQGRGRTGAVTSRCATRKRAEQEWDDAILDPDAVDDLLTEFGQEETRPNLVDAVEGEALGSRGRGRSSESAANSKHVRSRTDDLRPTGRSTAIAEPSGRPSSRIRRALSWGWLAACLAFALWLPEGAGNNRPYLNPATATSTATAHPVAARPIEDLRVGDRVLTDGSSARRKTGVDPASWRRLTLEARTFWDDGTLDVIHVETLQPPEWLAAHRATEGAEVPLPLDLVEMGLPEDLPARVVSIDRCPPLTDGPGRVVLTTVNHLNRDVRELTIRSAEGREETVRPTGFHKFYSATRNDWVSATDLAEGERLEGIHGPLTVARVTPLPGVHRVYNITVEGEHVYRVAALGALVHNQDCRTPGSYTNLHESGKTYSGKGDKARSQESGRRIANEHGNPHIATDWTPAPTDLEAYKKEHERIMENGGPGRPDLNYNKIHSPGKNY